MSRAKKMLDEAITYIDVRCRLLLQHEKSFIKQGRHEEANNHHDRTAELLSVLCLLGNIKEQAEAEFKERGNGQTRKHRGSDIRQADGGSRSASRPSDIS